MKQWETPFSMILHSSLKQLTSRSKQWTIRLCLMGAVLLLLSATPPHTPVTDILFKAGTASSVYIDKNEMPVVHTALSILQKDVQSVFDVFLEESLPQSGAQIMAGTIGVSPEISRLEKSHAIDLSPIRGKWEAFLIKTISIHKKTVLLIVGSDSRGTAYGLLELSRLIGVSPWEWWADVKPAKRESFAFPSKIITQSPSIQYRGIFINDEDWGLNPWSSKTFETDSKTLFPVEGHFKGAIGPKTYAKVFELLLRLRANTIWPAMHEVTMPFYFVQGNKEAADKYGIVVGTSHCEPLMRNSATEWNLAGTGDYNYLINRENVISYWTDRLKQLQGAENIFTIGMRGKHDGKMEGVKNTQEYKDALTKVLADQKGLLERYIVQTSRGGIKTLPQVFVPYKEVLDVYDAGLEVPDYVTLIWPDDNFGYIRHFPTSEERKRGGGNGVYYHLSYWGAPHDYLWLGTMSPSLIYQQMKLAYDRGIQKMWIVNVGDIKPTEYQLELFLDMAWNLHEVASLGITSHLNRWLEREFGSSGGKTLLPVLQEYFRLAYIRKPEFMGNTMLYEKDSLLSVVKDLPWTEPDINERLHAYDLLSEAVEKAISKIPSDRQSAYFELVKYPVQAAVQMNRKLLYAQLARHGKADWEKSDAAYDSIAVLTQMYNALENGKWNRMMDFRPRNLPVFERVTRKTIDKPLPEGQTPAYKWNGNEYSAGTPVLYEKLGYEQKAAGIPKGRSLTYSFTRWESDSVTVDIRFVPTHPVEGKQLRFSVSIDGSDAKEIAYQTKEYSEEWKANILRNQAVRKLVLPVSGRKAHDLVIRALDEGIVLDQVLLWK